MSQVKDFPQRETPEPTDFLYLITEGNTDYKVLITQLLGEMTKEVIQPFYELEDGDQYHTIRMTFPSGKQLTVPTNDDVPFTVGTIVRIRNATSGSLTLIPATVDVTLNTKGGLKVIARGEVKLVKVGQDNWDVIGDLST